MDASIWLWLGVSYHLYIFIFFCLVQGFSNWDSKGTKKRVLGVCGNVQRKILCTWIWIGTTYLLSMNFMYSIDYIQAEHERIDGKRCIHTESSLFLMIAMYSIDYIQTEHERLDEKGCIHTTSSLFRIIKIANLWPVGPYLCGQIPSQNRPVMGTCSIW